MINNKGILIKNVYYMLSYAFNVLKQSNYKDIEAEEFDNIYNLFAAILSKGISQQVKQGLYTEYITKNDTLPMLKGKLNIQETIKNKIECKQVLTCEFDELSKNNILNQILKTALYILISEKTVDLIYKKSLKKVMLFFDDVDLIDPLSIRWDALKYNKNNQNYQMLMNICYFLFDSLLPTTTSGKYHMTGFSDESMDRLYEKFVLEYYRKHYKYLKPSASKISWNLDTDFDNSMINFLPEMKTDITLNNKDTNKTLIIDTKYYKKTMNERNFTKDNGYSYNSYSLHSNNLYQIFAYVKNKDINSTGNVSGLLLYAKTSEKIVPDCEFVIGGNRIDVKTLDLNKDFLDIKNQLDKIVEIYLM